MLPPRFDQKDAHTYGTFKLIISPTLQIRNAITKVQTFFFGSSKKIVQTYQPHQKNIFSFDIATNLWHFYAYLSDCRNIHLFITDSENQTYSCEVPLVLMSSGQVLNRLNKNIDYLSTNNSYLLDSKQRIRIFDERRKEVGFLEVEMDMKFDEQINRLLHAAGVVNMEDLLIIDEISPIPSAIQLQNFEQPREQVSEIQSRLPPHKNAMELETLKEQMQAFMMKKQERPKQTLQKVQVEVAYKQVDKNFEQDQRMVEDDIERLITEMQNRPYDSSRYLQNQIATEKKENINFANTSPLFSHTKSSYPQSIPPKYPSSTKAISSKSGLSPIKTSPIYSYSAVNPAQSDRVNYLMNKTTLTNHQFKRSSQKNLNRSESRQRVEVSTQKGTIRLKIHELMMQRYEEDLSLILKCFLNDDSDQYYTVNGIKQGETISFSSNMLINEKRQISLLRFVLIDSFDMKSIYAQGEFQMERLLSIKPTKGVFTVNMRSTPTQRTGSKGKIVSVEESRLVKVVPNIKTLRIQLQYLQQIEIVQIYLNLSNFSKTIKTCRYKIPMTKQTIEFRISELQNGKHINIFPHNRSSQSKGQDKIILELWSGEELIGINQVSLKALQNTNQRIIMSSLEPIYLYDQARNVQSISCGKTNNNFHLQLYYGTISQVQSILNQAHRKQPREQPNKKQVEVQQVLGVYVKQRKQQRQVQIQVSQNEVVVQNHNEKHLSKKTSLGLQQQQDLPEQEQESLHNQEEQVQNEFLNKSLEQKYLNKETIPIFAKVETQNQELNFKKTQSNTYKEVKAAKTILKSLTEQYQQLIKESLSDFSNEQNLKQLKAMVKDHLLYNFIEVDRLRLILQELGIQRRTSNTLLEDIIGHSNGMLNINVLYDMIYGLMLDGYVKEKYLDDAQVGKYCLSQLYVSLQKRGQNEELETLFDENVEYDEGKKIYQKVGYKLSLRQYSQIESYNKKMKESYKMDEKWIRSSLLTKNSACQKEQQKKEEHQKEVMQKLYQHAEWDQDDDFFISNINEPQQPPSQVTNNNSQTNRSYSSEREQLTSICKNQNITYQSIIPQKSPAETQVFIKKAQNVQKVAPQNSQTVKMTIEGFENCIETTECHLNISLTDPKLRVVYKNQHEQNQVILGRQESSCQIQVQRQKQYLDGSVSLISEGQVIARCNFSIIVDVRSVYTLKSVQQSQFCGLLYLRFRPL